MDQMRETVVSNALSHTLPLTHVLYGAQEFSCMCSQNQDLALRVSIAVTTSSAFKDLGFVTMTMIVGTILMSETVVS